MQAIDIKSVIKRYTYFAITLACFAFVLWKSVQCFEKYIENPQSTKLSLQHISEIHQFPAITICPYLASNKYDKAHLKRCGLRYENVFFFHYDYTAKIEFFLKLFKNSK